MNDVAVKHGTQVAVQAIDAAWGAEDVATRDVLVPRIQLTQALSELVTSGKCAPGSLVSTNLNEVLAAPGGAVEIMAIKTFREWVENEVEEGKNGKKKEKFLRIVPMTKQNENLPLEEMIDGTPIRRYRSLNFMAVLPAQLQSLPHVLQFRKTSYRTGQQLATHFKMSGVQGKPPARQVFALSAVQKEWEGNKFFVFDLAPKRTATNEEMEAAFYWYSALKESSVRTDEEAVVQPASADEMPSFS